MTMSEQAEAILAILSKAVETDQLKLPTLPEVALKIRKALEHNNQTAVDIALLLSQDSSMSARLLQLANSPLYRARHKIDNLQLAITRLGIRIVKDLVVMLAIKQAFKANNKDVDRHFREIWKTSIEVASICQVLAKCHPNLDPEQAILAGLIHNIGALPVIELANQQPSLIADQQNLADVCKEIQGTLGEKILSYWRFPQSLINVVSQCNNYSRQKNTTTDYVDLVQAAILHTGNSRIQPQNWTEISATIELGLDLKNHSLDESMQQQVENTRSSLMQI